MLLLLLLLLDPARGRGLMVVVLVVRVQVVRVYVCLVVRCLLLLLLLLLLAAAGRGRPPSAPRNQLALLLEPLFEMHFSVTFFLVASREFPSTSIALKRFFACVRSDVRREVVGPREGPHADPALERFLSCVDPNVPRQLVRPREPPVTILDGTRVRSLVHRSFTRPVRVLPRFHRHKLEGHRRLLVHLR